MGQPVDDKEGPWMASCDIQGQSFCDWSTLAPREEFCKILMVMHVLVKHPADYQRITGKDPEMAAYAYRDCLDGVKRLI